MPEMYVSWYDQYDCTHNSRVYFVDSTRDRFLVTDDNKNFHWVSTDSCELIEVIKN